MISLQVTFAGYAVLAVALVTLEVAGRSRRLPVPTFGRCLAWVMESRPGRWFVLLGWAWLGWHLFVR
ncbi:MAG: DUF6186 family protein [Carbonactinosporaceae bacterium]